MKLLRNRYQTVWLTLLLASAVGLFWLVEPASVPRLASLAFLVLVGLYALATERNDVLIATATFFFLADISQYLFDQVLPIWIGLLAVAFVLLGGWALMFGRDGWVLALTGTLAVCELLLISQFINASLLVQSLLSVSPYILISQRYYFQRTGHI